jgi:hypothetical protein
MFRVITYIHRILHIVLNIAIALIRSTDMALLVEGERPEFAKDTRQRVVHTNTRLPNYLGEQRVVMRHGVPRFS